MFPALKLCYKNCHIETPSQSFTMLKCVSRVNHKTSPWKAFKDGTIQVSLSPLRNHLLLAARLCVCVGGGSLTHTSFPPPLRTTLLQYFYVCLIFVIGPSPIAHPDPQLLILLNYRRASNYEVQVFLNKVDESND